MNMIDKLSCELLAKVGDISAIKKYKLRSHKFVISRGLPADALRKYLTHSPATVYKYSDNMSYIFISSEINSSDSILYNFVIFHEMGHVFYDRPRKSDKRSIREECIADSFALEMGMTKEEILLALEKTAQIYGWKKELKERYKYIFYL